MLESDPYRRLSYTWHTLTPELAERVRLGRGVPREARRRAPLDGDLRDRAGRGGVVKLTVVHDGFEPGSTVAEMVSGGWPAVIASLKTLLETGDPLPV